jgi:hypothetical protein
LASEAGASDVQLGDGWHIEGAARDATHADVPALAVRDGGVASRLSATLTADAAGRLVGPGGAPSLHSATIPSAATLLDAARARDDQRPLSGSASGGLGDGLFVSRAALQLSDASGSGVLLVDGALEISGTLQFAGLLVVNGDLRVDDGAAVDLRGAVVHSGATHVLALRGSGALRYDAPTLATLAAAYPTLLPRPAQITGWRELPEVGP